MNHLKLLFGMKERISQKTYLFWGLLLMVVKYLGELGIYFSATGEIFTPIRFLNPLITERYPMSSGLPDWYFYPLMLWTFPFIWIGLSMSIRRAADAGKSPWWGTLFCIPGLNYLLILVLCLLPASSEPKWSLEKVDKASQRYMSPFLISLIFVLCGVTLVMLNANLLNTYGASLFVGAPLALGLLQGYLINQKEALGTMRTALAVVGTIFVVHMVLLLIALEGVICLAMSLPLTSILGLIGSVFGAAIARFGRTHKYSHMALMLMLPVMPVVESQIAEPYRDVVLSVVEIDAPPEIVWPNVVKFSDLPPTTDWLFELGVAHPLRARIEGDGVGAVRYCEFSTGDFVEPITAWEEPHRLAFDVRYQPQPMREFSIYDEVHAPHLDGYFRSVRGEFKLIPLEGGRTRLEGRTWYEMEMHPGWYWQFYGRWFIHKIHLRVLDHIKNLSTGAVAVN